MVLLLVMVLSLDDWEKQWKQSPQRILKPTAVQVDVQAGQTGAGGTEREAPVGAAGQVGA